MSRKEYLDTYLTMIALRGLTDHTLKSYRTYISAYLDFVFDLLKKDPADVTWDEMRLFIKHLQETRNLADRTINTAIAQLRFFTMYVLHKPWDQTQIPVRKFDQYIPFVPSREEVAMFINAIDDPKTRAMVILMYSSGLRVGEVCRIKCEDIDRNNMRIHITRGKNRSDRYAMLSPVALKELEVYWRRCGRPRNYLFPQRRNPDKPHDPQTVEHHMRSAEAKLGWEHRFTCHSLRHAFATHFYEDTHDLLTLKHLLGHRSLNSTTIYVTLSNATLRKYASPFDALKVNHG
ncbi:MAG: tyrosine-type recombinase/integrase [Mogibacterium sp.]|nr:tyrosine-type recombinase/integrase [Mogibacterium sp.]